MSTREIHRETKLHYFEWHEGDIATLGEIRSALRNCESVLDLGCGTGWLSIEIANLGVATVVGVDIDEAVLGLGERSGGKVTGICTRSDKLPLANESFDLIIAKDIVEHLILPSETVSEVYRVLKKDGAVYATAPSPKSRTFYDDYTHVRPFTKRSISSLFEDAGLVVEATFYTGSYPGMGKYMRLRGLDRLPTLAKLLAEIGLMRNNVHLWARKP